MFGDPGKGNSGVLTSSECETVNILISVNDVITTLLVSVTIIINMSLFFFDLTIFLFSLFTECYVGLLVKWWYVRIDDKKSTYRKIIVITIP